jgi:hypothetical protein
MSKPTPEQLAVRRRLHETGMKIECARKVLQAAMEEARRAALDAIATNSTPESIVAYELGVDRMTVRAWQGRR